MSTKPPSHRGRILRPTRIDLARQLRRNSKLTAQLWEGLYAPTEANSPIRRGVKPLPQSAAEPDLQTPLSVELGRVHQAEASPSFALIEEVRRMLNGLRRSLRTPG